MEIVVMKMVDEGGTVWYKTPDGYMSTGNAFTEEDAEARFGPFVAATE